jgi:hypothetical protein
VISVEYFQLEARHGRRMNRPLKGNARGSPDRVTGRAFTTGATRFA